MFMNTSCPGLYPGLNCKTKYELMLFYPGASPASVRAVAIKIKKEHLLIMLARRYLLYSMTSMTLRDYSHITKDLQKSSMDILPMTML